VIAASRQLEGESGASTRAVAVDGQVAVHLAGGQHAVVQAEAVPILPRCESMGKDAGQVFRRNAHTVVDDFDADALDSLIVYTCQ